MMEGKKHSVAILGSGESGMGALRLAVKEGLSCFLSEKGQIGEKEKNEIQNLGVAFEEGGHTNKIEQYDEVVKSPGIPDFAGVIIELKKKGITVISEIEFASRYTDAKIVGITGSNGKTTTTLLTTHLLKSGGVNVASAGNVGNSFSDLLVTTSPDVIVLELSSFQLDDIKSFKPDIAVLLNITLDHLDRYDQSLENYADAKLRLALNMSDEDLFIFNTDDELIKARMNRVRSNMLEITTQGKVKNGAYYDERHLIFDCEKAIHVMPVEDLPLVGRHNHYNQMAAILVAIELGLPFMEIYHGLCTFHNAPHRLEVVGEIDNVTFVNDSKATNVDAVFYALEAINHDIVWIAGGVNKGNDYSQIKSLVSNKVKSLVCLGKDNLHLTQEFSNDVENCIEVHSAEEAVVQSLKLAKPGDFVLLSPACASFDLFRNYEDRGDKFKAAVLKVKEESKAVKI